MHRAIMHVAKRKGLAAPSALANRRHLRSGSARAARTAGALLWAAGCGYGGPAAHEAADAPPGVVIVAADTSGSTNAMRVPQIDGVNMALDCALVRDWPLEFWTFAHAAHRLWGPEAPSNTHALDEAEEQGLPRRSGAEEHITRPAILLEAIANDTAFRGAARSVVVLLTDGDAELAGDHARFVRAARAVAQHPAVRLLVAGIHPENRRTWTQAFAPCLGRRFQLIAPMDIHAALASVLEQ